MNPIHGTAVVATNDLGGLLGAPGQTVTLELAIADVSDSIYDRAVFIRAGSLGS